MKHDQYPQDWWKLIDDIIRVLVDSNDAAAREIGTTWRKMFVFLRENPPAFNELTDSHPSNQQKVLERFFSLIAARERGEVVSDDLAIEAFVEHSRPVTKMSKEICEALGAFGMFLTHKGQVFVDVPSRFLYTTALFGIGKKVLDDLLDSHPLSPYQREIIMRIASVVPKHRFGGGYFKTMTAAASLERSLGFSVRLLSQRDVYIKGSEFYQSATLNDRENTLTFANTSGLWNPLERLGSSEFEKRYGIAAGFSVDPKDGYRAKNFSHGILNAKYKCNRLYFFNPAETWASFRKAMQAARCKTAFEEDAGRFVRQVSDFITDGRLHLVALENFAELDFPKLITRISAEIIMFSNRNSDKANIAHALWCNLPCPTCQSRVLHSLFEVAADKLPLKRTLSAFLPFLFKLAPAASGEVMRYALLQGTSSSVELTDHLRDTFGFVCRRGSLTGPELKQQLKEQIRLAQQPLGTLCN